MICLYLLSFNIDLLFHFFDVIFKHFDYVFERNMYFRCSNFLFNYLLTTKLSSSELQLYFSTRSCRLVGSFFLKILFQLFNLFAKREEFLHILHEHDLCGAHGMCEALENRKVTKMLTLYRTLSQMTLHHQHYNLRLKNISQRPYKYYRCFYFLSPLKFPDVNVLSATRVGLRYITPVQKLYQQNLFIFI